MSDFADAQRLASRQYKAAKASDLIRRRLGGSGDPRETVEHVRIASLSAIAEARSVWDFMVSKGLASKEQREEFLDKAFDDLLDLVESKAAELAHGVGRG